MKKTEINKNVLKAVLCISAFCTATLTSVTPAVAYDGALPVSINQIMMETGGNIKHDTDMLRYKRDEKSIQEDYLKYNENRKFEGNEGQVIKNYNSTSSDSDFIQGQVQDIDTKGVFVNSIEVAPSSVLSQEEVNQIIQPIVGKNVFISDIQNVIDQLNNLYAEKGFVTAKAFLPEQTVENGHIYIELIESKVGNVSVEQNKWTRTKYITDRVEQKPGELFDIVELEKDILDFNRYNEGVNLTANLTAGTQPGTTDIQLTAHENIPFHVVGIMDNAGRYQTGRLRGGAMIYADSLFHNRDRLSLGSYFSGGAISPFADYNFPINKKDGRIGFMYSSTFAKIKWGPLEPLDLKSKSYIYSLYYSQPLVRKPGFELKSYAGLNYKRARTSILDDWMDLGVDEITSADVAFNIRKDTKHGIWYANQGVSLAVPIFDSQSSYVKINGGAIRLHDFSHGVIGQLKANYQVIPNNKHIPYLDQFQTGGLATVRGYSEGILMGKNGYYTSAELMFPLMPREITSPRSGEKVPFVGKYVKGAVFADHAGVFPNTSEDIYGGSYFLMSLGMGLRVQLPGDLSARLYWGYPLINNAYEADRKYGRFHFELTLEPNLDALLRHRSTAPAAPRVEAEYNYDDVRHYDYFQDGSGGAL
ncbi:ShlB/FhaC/HecB family hemolysin secretion/activation protein [bacterium]|nr:ShlB/FhaC/HecB family hemolysin secretion/activation protein [bacterium]